MQEYYYVPRFQEGGRVKLAREITVSNHQHHHDGEIIEYHSKGEKFTVTEAPDADSTDLQTYELRARSGSITLHNVPEYCIVAEGEES